jgi:hypothetical protein
MGLRLDCGGSERVPARSDAAPRVGLLAGDCSQGSSDIRSELVLRWCDLRQRSTEISAPLPAGLDVAEDGLHQQTTPLS